MRISEKDIKEIQVITDAGELIVSITGENIIEKDGFKVVCVPLAIGKPGKEDSMNKISTTETIIRSALAANGIVSRDIKIIAVDKHEDRYRVYVDGELYGIYDIARQTFVD